MTMERKLLSISIPTYIRYNCLSTLLKQIDEQIVTYNLAENIEVLICDNTGSEKRNFEYISPYLSKQYLRYIDNGENIGIINNILKVIEESSGKYCFPLGDDEELLDGKLLELFDILREIPDNIAAVYFDEKIADDRLVLNCFETAENHFWNFGNFGRFVINTDMVKEYFAYNRRNTTWPQTELVFNAAFEKRANFFIVKNRIVHSLNHHRNTRNNSFYILEGGFLQSIKRL
jgi:glycosyltransferase involved in cell wall biosynthesis